MDPDILPLAPTERFRFRCGPDVPCFNACCRDLVQLLTPLDVVRLRTHLGMTSAAFLERYTITYAGPDTGLPVVSLAPAPGAERICPFVTSAGCRVYPARPTSCRTYPVARAIRRDRATGRLTEHFALIREPHCRGFEATSDQTAIQWLNDQGAAADFAITDRLMDIIQLKNRLRPGPLPADDAARCREALYDVDGFRRMLSKDPVIGGQPIPEAQWRTALADDLALLPLAVVWVKHLLFGDAV